MHIDNGTLVGTYVSDRYFEKGTITIVLTDGDSTPTREYTRYKYVQTEQLTAIGVAVKDYGAVLIPETTFELFINGTLNAANFGVFVKFNDEYYNVGLSTLLAPDIGAAVTFNAGGLDSYAHTTFNATLPPYSVGNAGQVPTVDENGKVGWDDIPEELPSVTGNTGKFLGVNDGATGVEWKNVPNELPAIGDSDAGKVLKVNAEHTGTEWGAIPNELPTIAAGDAGKVLKVKTGGTGVEWGSAGNGTLYCHNITIKESITEVYGYVIIYNYSSTAFTPTTLAQFARTFSGKNYPINGRSFRKDANNVKYVYTGTFVTGDSDNNLRVYYSSVWVSGSEISYSSSYSTTATISDEVVAVS